MGGRPAGRRDPGARFLPQARARRPQPRGGPHHAADVVARPRSHRAGYAASASRRAHQVSPAVLGAVNFTAPTVDYRLTSPMLIVVTAALIGVLVEAFVPRRARFVTQVVIALVGLAAALYAVVLLAVSGRRGVTAGASSA